MPKMPKNAKKYECEKCNFICSKQSNFNMHLTTAKHMRLINANSSLPGIMPTEYKCICGNKYKHASSLSKHKKDCTYTPPSPEENIQTIIEPIEPNSAELLILVKELMIQMAAKDKQQDELIKQNLELQNTMREMSPHIGNNNNTTNTTNTNSNNTFNVQLYLENECKDAISLQDFIRNIEINMSHLVAISKDGYVDSISNLLIQSLNKMAVTDRPLHCTDLKRETVYIKDMETWNKSTADAPIMNGLINSIENKYYAEVKQYVRDNPQARELDTPEYNFYAKACVHSLGNYEDHDKLNKKIYKKVLPEVKLDKTTAS
jgi:hypothetical protein